MIFKRIIVFFYVIVSRFLRFITSFWYRFDLIDDILPIKSTNGHKIQWRQKILPDLENFQNNYNSSSELRHWFYNILMLEINFIFPKKIKRNILDSTDRSLLEIYPGVYYKILALILDDIKPKLSLEVGTLRGVGTSILSYYSEETVTFDILPIDFFVGMNLFKDLPNVKQELVDISNDQKFSDFRYLVEEADFIFVDGPKDGKFEKKMIPKIIDIMKPSCVLMIDDVLFNNMCEIWHEIREDKIEFTNFGHWSGSGLVIKDINTFLLKTKGKSNGI